MKASSKQLAYIHKLLTKKGLIEHKKEIVKEYSNGRCESSKELTMGEAKVLIMAYAQTTKTTPTPPKEGNKMEAPGVDKMKRFVLAMLHEIDWHQEGTKRVDILRLNKWLMSHSSLKKTWDNITTKEDAYKLVQEMKEVHTYYLEQRNGKRN